MKILLTNATCRNNKGDAAIVSTMISELKKQFPDAEFMLETIDLFKPGEKFDAVAQVKSFIYFALYSPRLRVFRYVNTLWTFVGVSLWLFLYKLFRINFNFVLGSEYKETFNNYTKADLIVPVGGGYLTIGSASILTALTLVLRALPMYIASVLRVPFVLYSQSIGPFRSKAQEVLMRWAIRRAKLIFVRETISESLLQKMGFSKDQYVLVPDAAFLFGVKTRHDETHQEVKEIGVTVRDWFASEKQRQFENEMALFAKSLLADGYAINFIPQVDCVNHDNDDDREVVKKIEAIVGKHERVKYTYEACDHYQVKEMYNKLHVLVGTRMHSNIFALTSYVPCLAIAYEYKTTGIMKDLGLGEWTVEIGQVKADSMKKKFDELINRRDEYLATMHKNLPPYLERAKSIAVKLRHAYEGN